MRPFLVKKHDLELYLDTLQRWNHPARADAALEAISKYAALNEKRLQAGGKDVLWKFLKVLVSTTATSSAKTALLRPV